MLSHYKKKLFWFIIKQDNDTITFIIVHEWNICKWASDLGYKGVQIPTTNIKNDPMMLRMSASQFFGKRLLENKAKTKPKQK